jgi:argininosuccinate lyase
MQEDKEGVFDAVDTILSLLDVFPPMVRTIQFNEDRMTKAAIADFTLATDAADLLARHGIPFREAHTVVGRLVGKCIAEGKTFADLSDQEWASIHPIFTDHRPPLDGLTSVRQRDVPGGPAPQRVLSAMTTAEHELLVHQEWIVSEREQFDALFARPSNAPLP